MMRACGFLAIWAVVSAPVAAGAIESTGAGTLRVVARDTVAVKPDQAELELGVTTDKKTATASITENERKMEQVLAVLKKEIGTDGDLKTSQLSVEPRFEETRAGLQTRHVLGYTVTNMVHVRVANVVTVGRLLDLAFQAGANTVERVEFTLKDPEAAENQALRAASAKARARATAMAEGQGLRVGEVISVSEGDREDPFGELARANVSANLRRANIAPEAGTVQVSAAVTVIFALKPR